MSYQILIVNDNSAGELTDLCYNSDNNIHVYNDYININNKFPIQKPTIQVKLYNDPEFNSINDFIHALHDFIVSNKAKKVLENHNLPIHEFISAEIIRNEKTFFLTKKVKYKNYNLLTFNSNHISSYYNHIDFAKSEINFIRNEKNIDINLSSIADLYSIINSNKVISNRINDLYKIYNEKQSIIREKIHEENLYGISWRTEVLTLKDTFDKNLDLFTLPLFSQRTYISERLRNAFIKEDITNILFRETGNNPNPKYLLNPKLELQF